MFKNCSKSSPHPFERKKAPHVIADELWLVENYFQKCNAKQSSFQTKVLKLSVSAQALPQSKIRPNIQNIFQDEMEKGTQTNEQTVFAQTIIFISFIYLYFRCSFRGIVLTQSQQQIYMSIPFKKVVINYIFRWLLTLCH